MNRIAILVAAVAAALCCGAVAVGSSGTTVGYRGSDHDSKCPSGPNCRLTFDGVKHGRKITTVQNFWFGAPARCDHGKKPLLGQGGVYAPKAPAHVNRHRKFDFRYSHSADISPKMTVHITGKFSKNFKNVSGTLRATSEQWGSYTNCDTGTDDWSAHRASSG
jgi:hypothetical protein